MQVRKQTYKEISMSTNTATKQQQTASIYARVSFEESQSAYRNLEGEAPKELLTDTVSKHRALIIVYKLDRLFQDSLESQPERPEARTASGNLSAARQMAR